MKRLPFLLSTIFFLLPTLFSSTAYAQIWNKVNPFSKNSSEDLIITQEDVAQMRKDMVYLTSENTKGRQAGTKGEEAAGMYIEQRMAAIGLIPIAPKRYRQHFTYQGAQKLSKDCRITIGKNYMFMPEDAIPTAFSAEGNEENFLMPESEEANAPWMLPLYNNNFEAQNPNFDWAKVAYQKAKYAEERGASAVIFYDNYNSEYKPKFTIQSEYEKLPIPVIIVNYNAYIKYLKPLRLITPITININYQKETHTSANIIGYINNNAPITILLTAHYDHLGTNGNIYYPGANENASGVTTLLTIASKLKNPLLNKYNYMVVALSAHEYEMNGIKSLIKSELFKTKKIGALININTVGRLKPNRELFIEGIASGNNWEKLINATEHKLKIKSTLELKTKSDEGIAYQNKIPVLLLTTGTFDDKRQLTDLPSKINFKGMEEIGNFSIQLLNQLNTNSPPQYTNIDDVIKRKKEESARLESQKIAKENAIKQQEERAKQLAIEKELQNEQARLAAQKKDSIINATNKISTSSDKIQNKTNTTTQNEAIAKQQVMRDSLIKAREDNQSKKILESESLANKKRAEIDQQKAEKQATHNQKQEQIAEQQSKRDSLLQAREDNQTKQRAEKEAAIKHRNEILAKQKEENEAKRQAALLVAQENADKEARARELQIKNAQDDGGIMIIDSIMPLNEAIGVKIDPKHNQGGVKIGTLMVNYAAQKAGFKRGDIIIQIGNTPIADQKQYEKTINSLQTNKTIYVKIRREGKLLQLPLKFKVEES